MKDAKASTATVLAAQQDNAPLTQEPVEKHSGGVLSIIAGFVLLLLGGAGVYIAYSHYQTKVQPVVLAPTAETPIFVDEEEKIMGETPAEVLSAIVQSLDRPLASGAVRLLHSDISTTTGNSVFSALELPAPGALARNINAQGSIAGVINVQGSQTPFFILSVASYSDTFAGMLSWEGKMPGDLAALFPPHPVPVASTTPAETASSAAAPSSVPIFSVLFHDEVVSNHDVRIYRDVEGRSILLYGYWNPITLVIARDPAAFAELLSRLATSRR